jgi:hypothetical protein
MSTVSRHLGKRFGYSCQTWLAVDIADRFFGGMHRPWFATVLNPQLNGSSSNPLEIFCDLDRIIHTNDRTNSRIDQLRRRLSAWILYPGVKRVLSASDIVALLREIASAPVPAFRPQIWKLDLSRIHSSRLISFGPFPNEYLIRDVVASEVEVVAS